MSIVTSTGITRTCYWSQCRQPRLHRPVLAPPIGTNSGTTFKRRRTLTEQRLPATPGVSHLQGVQQPQQQRQLRPLLQHQQHSTPSHQAAGAAAAAAVTANPDHLLLNALNLQSTRAAVPATVNLSAAAPAVPAVPAAAVLPAAAAAASPDQLPLIALVDRHLSQNTTYQVGDSAHLVSRTNSSSDLFVNLEHRVLSKVGANSESKASEVELLESHFLDLGSPSSGRSISSPQRGIVYQNLSGRYNRAEIVTVPTMATTTTAPPPPAAAAVPAPTAAAPTAAAGVGLLGGPAAAVVDKILATATPLSQITQVRMVMDSKCKMGISFWPMFSFKPPERDEKAGSAKLVNSSDVPAEMTAAVSSSSSGEVPSVSSQLLHVNFTQDPPDEFSVGAKFLGGIPFPFITIRTTKLEGTIDPNNGAVVLLFEAQFLAGVGKKEPTALTVNAHLTTEPATAFKTKMEGKRMENGRVMLVSAAEVPKTSSWFANILLWLPTAATAKLPMKLEFL